MAGLSASDCDLIRVKSLAGNQNRRHDIAWAVASLLQFYSGASPMKEAAGAPVVNQGQVPLGGQGTGMFSQTSVSFVPATMERS